MKVLPLQSPLVQHGCGDPRPVQGQPQGTMAAWRKIFMTKSRRGDPADEEVINYCGALARDERRVPQIFLGGRMEGKADVTKSKQKFAEIAVSRGRELVPSHLPVSVKIAEKDDRSIERQKHRV